MDIENAAKMTAINEYGQLEGVVRGEIITKLWDHGLNCHRVTRCVVIDLGRRPPVKPAKLTREDRSLLRLQSHQPQPVRSEEPSENLATRLHAWMKQTGAVTYQQAAAELNVNDDQAKKLLSSNTNLFKFWMKIAGQSFFVAI